MKKKSTKIADSARNSFSSALAISAEATEANILKNSKTVTGLASMSNQCRKIRQIAKEVTKRPTQEEIDERRADVNARIITLLKEEEQRRKSRPQLTITRQSYWQQNVFAMIFVFGTLFGIYKILKLIITAIAGIF